MFMTFYCLSLFLCLHKHSTVEILQNLDKQREESEKHPNIATRDNCGIIFYVYICLKNLKQLY